MSQFIIIATFKDESKAYETVYAKDKKTARWIASTIKHPSVINIGIVKVSKKERKS